MKNIHTFPDRRIIENEAYDWLIKLDRDESLDKQDREALCEWLGRSPVHRQELCKLNAFWGNNILTELVVPLGKHDTQNMPVLSARLWGLGGLTAAAVIAIFVVTVSFWFIPDPLTKTNGLYLTAVGQQKDVSLADGSTLQLNTNSQIEVDYSERYRNIRLIQGEVHFQVAENIERPFRVYAGGGRLQAIGTAFTVYLNNEAVNVLVTEGRVALASLGTHESSGAMVSPAGINTKYTKNDGVDPYVNSQSQNLGILKGGQSLTFSVADNTQDVRQELADSIEEVEDNELNRRQSWREGLLVFTGEPLEQVVQEVSRYTTISIEIADPTLRQLQIGGRFKVGKIDDMFIALETNFGLRANWLNYNRVELTAAQK